MEVSLNVNKTRPSVNYANNWLDQIFPFPGLVWPGKGFYLGCYHYRAINNHFPLYRAIFGMVTNDQTNKQLGDHSASLLLTSVGRQSFAKIFTYSNIPVKIKKLISQVSQPLAGAVLDLVEGRGHTLKSSSLLLCWEFDRF